MHGTGFGGWPVRIKRGRVARGDDGGRRQAVIADDTARHVDDHDHRKPLLLIGERPGL